MPADYTADDLKRLEEIRSIAAEMCGLCDRERATKESPAVPKTTIIAGAEGIRRYQRNCEREEGYGPLRADDVDAKTAQCGWPLPARYA